MATIDTRDMVLVHRAFRRELGLLPAMIGQVGDGDVTAAGRVAAHASEMLGALHHHHEMEDELLWPRLLDRAPAAGEIVHQMTAQHEAIGQLLSRVDVALPQWRDQARAADALPLTEDVTELHARLVQHLDEEERQVLPVAAQTITQAEWDELGERGFASIPKSRRLVFLGYILESADPAERSWFLTRVPAPARILYKLIGRRSYARETASLRAGLQQAA